MPEKIKNVLVVDDESMVARLISRFVSLKFGNKIVIDWVDSALHGVNRLGNPTYEYDLVITDWNCPHENGGLEIVQQCRKIDIHVIVYTGDLGNKNLNKVYEYGVMVIDKSQNIETLMDEIQNALFE